MIKSRRRALLKNAIKPKGRLPEEYQEVEWLRATGTQWCRTDYYPEYDSNKHIGIKGDLTLLISGGQGVIGADFDYTGIKRFGFWAGPSRLWAYYGRMYADTKYMAIPSDAFSEGNYDIHYEIIQNNVVINDNTYSVTRTGYNSSVPIMVGTVQGQGGTIASNNVLYKAFSIYDADTLLTDIVPCYRKSDGKAGFYQMNVPEGGTNFITNLGSGSDFLIGPDV